MLVRDILSLKGGSLYRIEPGAAISTAVEAMVRHDVGSLVVMEAGRLVGMLTFREVLQALTIGGGSLQGRTVSHVMVTDPLCGSPSDTVNELREIMTRHHVRYLPVQDGYELIGVVSFHDVARAMIKETSMENRLLRRYIETSE